MTAIALLQTRVAELELQMLERPEAIEALRPAREAVLARLREAERLYEISARAEAARQRRAVALAVAEAEGAAAAAEPSLEEPPVDGIDEIEDEEPELERRLTPWEREDFWRGVRCPRRSEMSARLKSRIIRLFGKRAYDSLKW